ncbi:alpha-amylase family protein [Rathayibacter sp. YIM 133350]|uniref:alpha-amylase family protein n=1 Tax=Rathayibacter sp. YIM 133350 TaxID=3131992 RepID=UPI00307F3BD9
MKITDTSDLWWKTAVVYCLDVERYMDFNGDGRGDFEGLSQRVDYLADLGVTCLWLMPFYPTTDRDGGYDITDFYGVDPRLGSHGDVVEFMRTAKDRGMRVIIDLVVNHTSYKHPWFLAARSSPDSPYRDYYVWRDEPPKNAEASVFPGEESGVWQYDEKAGQYYLHSFYKEQPDLNILNPKVRDEIAKVMGFWLELGVSGFRVDAVPFLLDVPAGKQWRDPHGYLADLRAFLQRRSSDAIMLGEVNLPFADQVDYFGGTAGSELNMQFDFITMQNLYLSLARGDARPVGKALAARPELAIESQWANFVRNHDELTLDKLKDDERAEVFAAFAPDAEAMRVYDRGIRRRLPPMLDGDPRRIRMVYSLLFSLPGTPVLFYGEEIGMGENLDLPGRTAVRGPMQWGDGPNGGFSTAPARRLVASPPTSGYAPEHVNVVQQRHDRDSLLRFIMKLATRYRASPEIGWGTLSVIDQPNTAVLVHSLSTDTGRFVGVHNFSAEAASVTFRLGGEPEGIWLSDLLRDADTDVDAKGSVTLALDAYGYRWLRVVRPGDNRLT